MSTTMLSSCEDERTEEKEREADDDGEEDEEEDPEDPRIWWVVRWVCQLLGYTSTTHPARLVWPQHSKDPYPPALVARYVHLPLRT